MMMKYSIVGLIMVIAMPLTALAHGPKDLPDDPALISQYRAGFAAYQQNDYAVAMEKWRPLAEKGSAAAQIFLGFMYAGGLGVTQDNAAAVHWYGEAAERDNTLAQVRLAIMYRDGVGVTADRVKALFWVLKAGHMENHMQKIAMALQGDLKKDMTPAEVDAAERLFHKGADNN
ncbi:MAG: sel1 repeat family protein [Alphaproteobacteria bacterium]|nr:sel1 repeat family protein [Alphaproteobacteria bacterium]